MIRFFAAFAICSGFFVPSFSRAEEPKSIYDIQLGVDLAVTGAALLGTGGLYYFDKQLIRQRCPCSLAELNAIDRGVVGNHNNTALVASDVLLGVSMIAPLAIDFVALGWSRPFFEDALVYSQVLALTGVLTSVTKVIVQRPLPRSYEGDPAYLNSPNGYRSFFSGHTAMTTAALSAAAMTLRYRTQPEVWPWLIVGGVGVTVAAGRIAGGVHFYSDVAVGAAVGTMAGIVVPWLHRKGNSNGSVLFLPQQGGGMALWTRKF
jgi:membrane-associated phospholipid phosphatase